MQKVTLHSYETLADRQDLDDRDYFFSHINLTFQLRENLLFTLCQVTAGKFTEQVGKHFPM